MSIDNEKKDLILEDIDTSWLEEFNNLDKEYKDYYTEELDTIKIHYIYINKNNEIERVIEDKLILKTPGLLSKEEIISMNNNFLDKQNKSEYLLNDKIDVIRDTMLNKNVADFIYETYDSDDIIYKSLNSNKYSNINKEYIENNIEKIKKNINWNMKLGEWNLLKDIIIEIV